jgi:DNA helicase-4
MALSQSTIQPAALHRLLAPQSIKSIQVERDAAIIFTNAGSQRVELAMATVSSSSTWLILKSLVLQTTAGSFALNGLPTDAIGKIQFAIDSANRRKSILDTLSASSPQASERLQSWEALTRRDSYFTARDLKSWIASADQLASVPEEDADLLERLPDTEQRTWRKVFTTKANGRKSVVQHNAAYAQHQLQSYAEFFNSVESNPLTEQQREAIVHDEDNTLVIAGAGTGKTSTIVGKVGYILKKGLAEPDEILLLAFTSKAAEEMRERLEKKLGIGVKVRTFHGLGLEIISQAERKKPSLCPEAEDSVVKAQTIKKLIVTLLSDSTFCQNLMLFQSALRRPYKPAWKFKSLGQYTQYLLDSEPRALTGRLLKSYEECEIANWLFINGIRAEYELPYSLDTSTNAHRQYKPDFFLPDYGVYIEHWGVDHDDNTAPFVDRAAYVEKMAWARELHAANGTTLVETYSWERQEGVLLSSLEAKLREHGVEPQPISKDDALTLLNDAGRFDPLVTLISTFMSLFKSACISLHELRMRQIRDGDAKRNAWFMGLFEKLHVEYEQLIRSRGEIDFDDMINLAREHVERGSYRSQFRYILVDEFQDIALGRARLIQVLRDQVDGAKLFAVGDDWQSIY